MKSSLSLAEARRMALFAQGFNHPARDKRPTWSQMHKSIQQLQLLQLDSVNVLVRSHYLPIYSRLGAYNHSILDARTFDNAKRTMFECWCHEASLVPLPLHPLMRWRTERSKNGKGKYGSMSQFANEEKSYLKTVLNFVKCHGPTAVSDMPDAGKGAGGWWGWSKGKMALETLFDQGHLTTAGRPAFERIYDLTENVIPAEILNLPTPTERDTFRQLLNLSGKAHGIGTEFDLRDYFRLPGAETKAALGELVESGDLILAKVEDWKPHSYIHKSAKLPKTAGGTALVSPFDPLVWDRDRAERLFNFLYRIEIYTPQEKRKFGYYVLPFLHGDRFAGRVCLKADRQAKVLRANASHVELHADIAETAAALSNELLLMAEWLGLDGVEIMPKGELAQHVKYAL